MLERSLGEIFRRHESLRTSFRDIDGSPLQVIAASDSFRLDVRILSNRSPREAESEALRLAREDAWTPFDLTRGPLFRVTLLRLAEHDHVLLLTVHHIISDAWSRGVLFRELSLLYRAYSEGRQSPLPELPIQYPDFAAWQLRWLQGDKLAQQLSYWRKQLRGIPSAINLPLDRAPSVLRPFRGAIASIKLSQKVTTDLNILSRNENVTLFMTLLAAFQLLLQRYSGQNDIVVGSPVADVTAAKRKF